MFTKPLVKHPVVLLDETRDRSSINRLLVAAAINQRFCAKLLTDPQIAIRSGFGGEQFLFSSTTQEALSTIKASTLSDFVSQLEERLPYRLHIT